MKAQTLRRTSSQGPSKMKGADVPILFLEKWLQPGVDAGEYLSGGGALLDPTQRLLLLQQKDYVSSSSVTSVGFSPLEYFFLPFAERLALSRESGLDHGWRQWWWWGPLCFPGPWSQWPFLLAVSLLIYHHCSLGLCSMCSEHHRRTS